MSNVSCKGKVVPVQCIEAYEVAEVELCSFLTLALDVDDWPISQSLYAHWIQDWVSPKAGLDVKEEKDYLPLPGIEPWFHGHSSRSFVTKPTTLCAFRELRIIYGPNG